MGDVHRSTDTAPIVMESLFVTASDGVRLHVKAYRPASVAGLPVVCLPGLARTERDFETLARHLALDPKHPRQVFALDYRGRGLSAYDPDWQNYNLSTELADVITALTALEIQRAILVGTSRGGLLTMLLAVSHASFIAGAVLNDIGPVIEQTGLMRIKGYIGKMPLRNDYAEGAETLRHFFGAQFPALSNEDWLAWSKRNWTQAATGMATRYDPNLGNTLNNLSLDQPIPVLWEAFDSLAPVPLMVVRGALSDLLSEQTVAAMLERRPDMDVVVVPDQGHAPLLAERAILRRIEDFCRRCDAVPKS